MSSSLNSHIVDLVAPGARRMAVASERRRALLLALAGLAMLGLLALCARLLR